MKTNYFKKRISVPAGELAMALSHLITGAHPMDPSTGILEHCLC
jgi:hypothetical protein